MTICEQCQEKVCLKTNKVCGKVENIMRDLGIKSDSYIRPTCGSGRRKKNLARGLWYPKYREIPFSSMEDTAEGRRI